MHRALHHHGCTTGRALWVVITVALGLALGQQATAATECARAIPLPAEVHLIAPGTAVPEAVARFAGAWVGEWDDSSGLCHALVVEAVLANGSARVIYSVGASVTAGVPLPRFMYVTGKIVHGILRFRLPEPDRPVLTYQLAGETLQGTFKDERRVRLTRVADIRQVGCEQPPSALPPAPPATGPRDRLQCLMQHLLSPT